MGVRSARILLRRIGPAHGIRGQLLIHTYTELPEDIASYGALKDESGTRQFEIEIIRVTPKGVVARITGVEDRTAAEALRGTDLYVDRERLPPPEEEEFYHSDLIGLDAFEPDGTHLGEVTAVHNFGAGDILEIRPASGNTEMLPFTREAVPEIDLTSKRLIVVMPASSEEE